MNRQVVEKYFFDLIKRIDNEFPSFLYNIAYLYSSDFETYLTEECIEETLDIEVKFGASKVAIILKGDEIADKYIVKIPFMQLNDNYCSVEEKIYNEINTKHKDFVEYFAECWKAFSYRVGDEEIPIYIMEKADIDNDLVEMMSHGFWSSTTSEYFESDIVSIHDSSREGYGAILDAYGEYEGVRLINLVEDLGINDLHSYNLGFINHKLVLIDYSGYYG